MITLSLLKQLKDNFLSNENYSFNALRISFGLLLERRQGKRPVDKQPGKSDLKSTWGTRVGRLFAYFRACPVEAAFTENPPGITELAEQIYLEYSIQKQNSHSF